MESHIGYKKCRQNRIVKLEIKGINNENRSDIYERKYASMRCSEALVLDIYDAGTDSETGISNAKRETAQSIYDPNFIYKVGEIVVPDFYDENENEVVTNGIHYFLNEKQASKYQYVTKDNGYEECHQLISGPFEEYNHNGHIRERSFYINGKHNGLYERWTCDDELYARCFYENGLFHGKCEIFYPNGQLCEEETYVNGVRSGTSTTFKPNGDVDKVRIYKNGVLVTDKQ